LAAVKPPIMGLSPLISEIYGENVNSGLYAFGVITDLVSELGFDFLNGYGVWSLDAGG